MGNPDTGDIIHKHSSPLRRAARIGLLYALLAGLWIVLSDVVLAWLVRDPQWLSQIQTLKGWAFVAFTAVLLVTVLHRQFRADARLLQRYAERGGDMLALSQFRESIIDNASIWINVLDPAARVTVWNKAAEQISGFSREDVLGKTDIWEQLYPDAAYRSWIAAKVVDILNDGLEVKGLETRIKCRDGGNKTISWNSRRFFDEHGDMGSIAIGLDITSRNEVEQALLARERQLAILMANVPGMVYRCSHDDNLTMSFVSSGCLALTGYAPEALIGNREASYASLIHPGDRERVLAETRKSISEGQSFALEYRIVTRNGHDIWVWEQGRAMHSGDEMHLEGIIVNITDRKQMEQKLEQLAVQDPLTGLFNRRELALLLRNEIARAERNQRPFALLWIDIDNFKTVNDRFGHLAGDDVLRRVSHLVEDNIRGVDYAARFGGDELVVALPEMSAAEALTMAERLQRLVQSAGVLSHLDPTASVTISVGVAAYPEHGSSIEQLSGAADGAMYAAKQAGRNRVRRAETDSVSGHMDPARMHAANTPGTPAADDRQP